MSPDISKRPLGPKSHLIKNYWPNSRSEIFFSYSFFYNFFKVLALIFKSMINSELIFVYGVKQDTFGLFFFLRISPTCFAEKTFLFSLNYLTPFQKSTDLISVGLFLDYFLSHWTICHSWLLYQLPHYCSFTENVIR